MLSLLCAAVFFMALHLGVAGTKLRNTAIAALGERIYMALFSIGSIVGLIWLVIAYNHAPYIATWGLLQGWKAWAIALMLPATCLVVIGLTTPNPTSVAQEKRLTEPAHGIVRVTRHPFLAGVAIWALVHLIGNGDVASLLFFATWAIVALVGTVSIDAKRRRVAGADWARFEAATSIIPFGAIAAGRNRFSYAEIGLWRWGAALLAYLLLLGGHGPIIGLPLLPA
jgi:uncharacterized membrane protein